MALAGKVQVLGPVWPGAFAALKSQAAAKNALRH